MRNKKGAIQDLMYIGYFALLIALSTIIAQFVFSGINAGGLFDQQEESQALADQFEATVFPAMDSMFLITYVASFLFAAFLAWKIRAHPAFFWIYATFLAFAVWLSGIWSNIYEAVLEKSNGLLVSSSLNVQDFIMGQLPLFTFGIGLILMFIMYGMGEV